MAKVCLYNNCNKPVFSHLYCGIHQYLRTDEKYVNQKNKSSNKKRTYIPKMSTTYKDGLRERQNQHNRDVEFFNTIWQDRPHIDFEDGSWLGNEPLLLFFHHVLPKGERAYKRFRYAPWNIVLLNWENHSKEFNLKFLPNVKAYKEYLLKHLTEIIEGTFVPSFEMNN